MKESSFVPMNRWSALLKVMMFYLDYRTARDPCPDRSPLVPWTGCALLQNQGDGLANLLPRSETSVGWSN